jgi:hypothetical protein
MNGISGYGSSAYGYGLAAIGRANAQATQSAANIARSSVDGTDNLPRDLVSLDQAKHLNAAAVKVIQTADEMQKTLIDLLA